MKADSIEFKGYSCFKNEWVTFDTIKPINVIIGRNNSGKSHLLDLVEVLCDDDLFQHELRYRGHSVLHEERLKEAFPEDNMQNRLFAMGDGFIDRESLWDRYVQPFVGKKVIWEFGENDRQTSRKEMTAIEFPDNSAKTSSILKNLLMEDTLSTVKRVLKSTTHHRLGKNSFHRLLSDRDIEIGLKDMKMELGRNGQGATNIIRRFITSDKLPREVIEKGFLAKLKLIFESDSQFLNIGVQELDDKTDETGSYWEVYLYEEKKGWIPLSRSGSGLKTVILVLLNLLVIPKIPDETNPQQYKYKPPFTFAFEELENNLHPALLRRLFQYLEEYAVSEKATIFLTTHSSIALDFFGTSDHAQIIHVSHDGESARTTTVPTHFGQLKIISELGARPSDLLQSNGLIWVEGPTDRIYLNHWIELYTRDRPQGSLREGRDYQCVFYGGSLLARVQFTSPEEEAAELANLFRINPNFFVVCDGDRETEDSDLKPRVKRIREEVEKIDDERIWITDAKEIENYLPGSVLSEVTGLSSLPDPRRYESWSSYTEEHMQGKSLDKVDLAISSTQTQYMTREVMEKQFDWKDQIEKIVKCIDSWNKNGSSEGL